MAQRLYTLMYRKRGTRFWLRVYPRDFDAKLPKESALRTWQDTLIYQSHYNVLDKDCEFTIRPVR